MSDSKKKDGKMPPPDDFSKTTPNVNIQGDSFEDSDVDWDKTQYGNAPETPADDWGKTVINYDVSSLDEDEDGDDDGDDFGSQQHPSPKSDSAEPDWGLTQQNINLDDDFGGENSDDSIGGATVPYFKLPDAEKEKYQNIPPTPTEKAKAEEEEQKKKGGIPLWFWAVAGLMVMFSFAVVVLLGVWFIFTGPSSFTVRVQAAQPYSQFLVDNRIWGVTNPKRTHDLVGLRPGSRKITVRKKGYEDFEKVVEGERGDIKTVIAVMVKSKAECGQIDLTSVKQREDCANLILNNLDNPPDLDDLLRALNLYYINFASGEHTIPEGRKKFLERAATYMRQLPTSVVIEIGGHTDNVGQPADNQALSERRAKSVRDFFTGQGINQSMLSIRGYGQNKPKESNATTEGKFQNRRIEYTVTKR